jgi:ethanolamine utilization protein EutN
MLQAIVVGHVWSTKRIDGLPNGAFLEVEVIGSADRLVAFDVLGSGRDERVLIAQGSVASGWLPGRPPVDALIIGSIDEPAASAVPSSAVPSSAVPSSAVPSSAVPSGAVPSGSGPDEAGAAARPAKASPRARPAK